MAVKAKICGLTSKDSVDASVKGGAFMTGFVFFKASPRNISPANAHALTSRVPDTIHKIGLVVDADDPWLDDIVKNSGVNGLQCHGSETPERIRHIKNRYGLPVIKALAVATADDLQHVDAYRDAADMILFDARPPKGADRPGGNALSFDWSILSGQQFSLPWLLAGGINAGNITEAVRQSRATMVDVSSGLETAPGVKSVDKIQEFLKIVSAL